MTHNRAYLLPAALVRRTWDFLRDRGRHGQEGMALWAGRLDTDPIAVSKLVIPAQTAMRTRAGVCVVMSDDAKLELRSQLSAGQHYVIRIHSHPKGAFHSKTDDENLVISHDGAISIVVPRFAAEDPGNLAAAFFEYCAPGGWTKLTQSEIARRFTVR